MTTYTFQSAKGEHVCLLLTVLIGICGRKIVSQFVCAQIDPSPRIYCFLTTPLPPHLLGNAMATLPQGRGQLMLETLDIE